MALFRKRRKKKDTDEGDSDKKKTPSKAKVRRKKKEPAKPWGRKERFLTLFILVFTIGISGILGLYSRGWKLPGLPRIKVPKINIPFVGEETIVIVGNKEEAEKKSKAKSNFVSLTENYSGIYGLHVVRLGGGSSYGVNEDDIMQAASLIKLPVMASMYIKAEKGELNLEDVYVLKKEDKVGGAGSLQYKPVGYETTYKELLELMGKQSDNTAFKIVKNRLGEDEINSAISEIGMENTSLSQNTTTPSDVGLFFKKLWEGDIVSDEHKNEMLEFLTNTDFEKWLTEGIPENIQFAHKFGRELHVVNDAGIVLSENPYVIVVMADKIVEKEADEALPLISEMIYQVEVDNK